jgi:hypothetical protein
LATFAAVFSPSSASGGVESVTKVSALAAGASSAEIVLGSNQLFAISSIASATAAAPFNINLEFGPPGLGAATASDMGLPVGQVFTFDMSDEFRSIRVFNNCATGPVDIYVLKLKRT